MLMSMKRTFSGMFMGVVLIAVFSACGGGSGTLQFTANGEDFIRQGFTSKDGWEISFDHVYVTLSDLAAHQTTPPFIAENGAEIRGERTVKLKDSHTIDLALGDEEADPIEVGKALKAPAGHYNAISWKLAKASSGVASGYSLIMIGQARKDGTAIKFDIKLDDEVVYSAGEFIGDERKGIVAAGAAADVEMTFHFDHIFGDAELSPGDEMNIAAVGFQPFAALAQNSMLSIDSEQLKRQWSSSDYNKLAEKVVSLGHVGEGHAIARRVTP